MCGEGGEYESAVFDCPLFKTKRIVCTRSEILKHVDNDISPVAYLKYHDLLLVEKEASKIEADKAILEAMAA